MGLHGTGLSNTGLHGTGLSSTGLSSTEPPGTVFSSARLSSDFYHRAADRTEVHFAVGQPQPGTSWAAARARGDGDGDFAGGEMAMTVADAAPTAIGDAQHRLGLWPRPEHDEGRPALPQPCG